MKIYIWNNGNSDSDFIDYENINMDDILDYSSNAHSGGIVVLAKSKKEAIDKIIGIMKETEYEAMARESLLKSDPVVINMKTSGVVLFANGDC